MVQTLKLFFWPVSTAKLVASSLLGVRGSPGAGDQVLSVNEVLWKFGTGSSVVAQGWIVWRFCVYIRCQIKKKSVFFFFLQTDILLGREGSSLLPRRCS